jgi:hypothetical protein
MEQKTSQLGGRPIQGARDRTVILSLSGDEHRSAKECARALGIPVATLGRMALLREVRRTLASESGAMDSEAQRAAFTE